MSIFIFLGILLFFGAVLSSLGIFNISSKKYLCLIFLSLFLIAFPLIGSLYITKNDKLIAKFDDCSVYQDDNGISYVLDIHSFKFWDMYEKKELSKDYAETLKQAYLNYKKYNISQENILKNNDLGEK